MNGGHSTMIWNDMKTLTEVEKLLKTRDRAWCEGYEAHKDGKCIEECPIIQKTAWIEGYKCSAGLAYVG